MGTLLTTKKGPSSKRIFQFADAAEKRCVILEVWGDACKHNIKVKRPRGLRINNARRNNDWRVLGLCSNDIQEPHLPDDEITQNLVDRLVRMGQKEDLGTLPLVRCTLTYVPWS